jgi:hypothetical protein
LIHALLGHNDEAVREGERASELMSRKMEPVFSPNIRLVLAQIYLLAGRRSDACAVLRELLSEPGDLTVAVLRSDPAWDAARNNSEFQALLVTK